MPWETDWHTGIVSQHIKRPHFLRLFFVSQNVSCEDINTKFHEVLDFLSKAYDCLNEPYVRDTLHLI